MIRQIATLLSQSRKIFKRALIALVIYIIVTAGGIIVFSGYYCFSESNVQPQDNLKVSVDRYIPSRFFRIPYLFGYSKSQLPRITIGFERESEEIASIVINDVTVTDLNNQQRHFEINQKVVFQKLEYDADNILRGDYVESTPVSLFEEPGKYQYEINLTVNSPTGSQRPYVIKASTDVKPYTDVITGWEYMADSYAPPTWLFPFPFDSSIL